MEFSEAEGLLIHKVFPPSEEAGSSSMPKISQAKLAYARSSNRQFRKLHLKLREKYPSGDLRAEYLWEAVRRWRESKSSSDSDL